MDRIRLALRLAVSTTFVASLMATAQAQEVRFRIAGTYSQNTKIVEIERPFFEGLAKRTGINLALNYNPIDVLGVKAQDALRLISSGAFDVMSIPVGMMGRDDPFFEGMDLIGLSPDMPTLEKTVKAYRGALDKRLDEKFKGMAMALWPYGPQVFYCAAELKSLDDLKGLKVRSLSLSMSVLLQHLGASPVTLQFSEVYPALQRGVASCGLTSTTSGNQGNWPEVTTHLLPLGVSWAMQAHVVNRNTWAKFSPQQQQTLRQEFAKFDQALWDLARTNNDDALNCNVGREPCRNHKKFNMRLVEVSDSDRLKLQNAVQAAVLPAWGQSCERVSPGCTKTWNETIGAARNMKIQPAR